jgi:hypothetical protein
VADQYQERLLASLMGSLTTEVVTRHVVNSEALPQVYAGRGRWFSLLRVERVNGELTWVGTRLTRQRQVSRNGSTEQAFHPVDQNQEQDPPLDEVDRAS